MPTLYENNFQNCLFRAWYTPDAGADVDHLNKSIALLCKQPKLGKTFDQILVEQIELCLLAKVRQHRYQTPIERDWFFDLIAMGYCNADLSRLVDIARICCVDKDQAIASKCFELLLHVVDTEPKIRNQNEIQFHEPIVYHDWFSELFPFPEYLDAIIRNDKSKACDLSFHSLNLLMGLYFSDINMMRRANHLHRNDFGLVCEYILSTFNEDEVVVAGKHQLDLCGRFGDAISKKIDSDSITVNENWRKIEPEFLVKYRQATIYMWQ